MEAQIMSWRDSDLGMNLPQSCGKSKMNANEPFGPWTSAEITPELLARDITHYETKASVMSGCEDTWAVGMRRVYQAIASNRRELLAALQDARPELWTDYPDGNSTGTSDADGGYG